MRFVIPFVVGFLGSWHLENDIPKLEPNVPGRVWTTSKRKVVKVAIERKSRSLLTECNGCTFVDQMLYRFYELYHLSI